MLPLHLSFSTPPGTRLRQLLVLLLLAVGLLAGVSVSQTYALEAQAIEADVVVLPALQRLHELAGRVDEQRGMAALHLTLQADAERAELEGRLQASRQQLERRMAAVGQRLRSDSERQHHQAVLAGLAAFWDAQDRVLAASRRAVSEPAAAQQARAILTGEAQLAYQRLHAAIEAWWSHTEQAAVQLVQLQHAGAHLVAQLVWAQAALVALALAVAWAMLQAPARPPGVDAVAPPALDDAALQAHLQSLNAAVAAARRGEPGRAAGLSAQEAQHLAEQVDAAAQRLRRLIATPAPPRAGAGPAQQLAALGETLPEDRPPPR